MRCGKSKCMNTVIRMKENIRANCRAQSGEILWQNTPIVISRLLHVMYSQPHCVVGKWEQLWTYFACLQGLKHQQRCREIFLGIMFVIEHMIVPLQTTDLTTRLRTTLHGYKVPRVYENCVCYRDTLWLFLSLCGKSTDITHWRIFWCQSCTYRSCCPSWWHGGLLFSSSLTTPLC